MSVNKWKEIWAKRSGLIDEMSSSDLKTLFLELKRLDGFDIKEGG